MLSTEELVSPANVLEDSHVVGHHHREVVAPRAKEVDETGEYPHDFFDAFKKAGLLGIPSADAVEALAGPGEGREVARLDAPRSREPVPVRIRLSATDRANLQKRLSLRVDGPGGAAAGALLGYAAGSIASLPMFYGSQAQESYEAVKKTQLEMGRPEAEADAIARRTAHVEGGMEAGGELAADVIPLAGLFKPLAKAGAKAAGELVKSVFFPGILDIDKYVAEVQRGEPLL